MDNKDNKDKRRHHHFFEGMSPKAKNVVAIIAALASIMITLAVGLDINIGDLIKSKVDSEMQAKITQVENRHKLELQAISNKHQLLISLSGQVEVLVKTVEALRIENSQLQEKLEQIEK